MDRMGSQHGFKEHKEEDSDVDTEYEQVPISLLSSSDIKNQRETDRLSQQDKASAQQEQKAYDDELFKVRTFKRRQTFSINQSSHSEATEVFCLAYTADSRFVAAGCGDGSIRIFNAAGKRSYTLGVPTVNNLPATCIRFRPTTSMSSNKNILIAANADGTVSHWHMMSQTCIYSIQEEDNQIYAVDYRPDGLEFVTGGRDAKVRVYDEATKTLVRTLVAGKTKGTLGHSNRVYSARFKPDEPDIIVTGGWDNTVQIWDTRAGYSVRSIFGPHICGDALEVHRNGKEILTGSWRPDNALEVWDIGTGKMIRELEFQKQAPKGMKRPEMLYTVSYSPEHDLVAAGGSGTNEAKILDLKSGNPIDRIPFGDGKGVFTTAFAPNGRKLAVGGGNMNIIVVDLQ